MIPAMSMSRRFNSTVNYFRPAPKIIINCQLRIINMINLDMLNFLITLSYVFMPILEGVSNMMLTNKLERF